MKAADITGTKVKIPRLKLGFQKYSSFAHHLFCSTHDPNPLSYERQRYIDCTPSRVFHQQRALCSLSRPPCLCLPWQPASLCCCGDLLASQRSSSNSLKNILKHIKMQPSQGRRCRELTGPTSHAVAVVSLFH